MERSHQFDNRKVGDLIPYINNARTHSDVQIKQIASSIQEFGFTNPILIDEDNGIIAGHGRLLAAELLNIETVPVYILKGLTPVQKKAYVLADNQLALNAGWDEELLAMEIEFLQEADFDIDLLGFDEDFLSFMDSPEQDETESNGRAGSLTERFLISPFIPNQLEVAGFNT
ncbi:ParB/Srx family N-terminal domain-containing protein [Vibrio algivorus]|uniref:ParB-like N-terminal domain-containing protein n=1 Tax=Vibrio algivorus TaxID=1667024 RepID=A0A557P9N5_9VIBR|nr:ParB/Srx family N-terminal domain-containing protein [Vibrio algivorus]TVO37359.1 hypothetical protein FOF44_07045 [Vibrio algivorus]